LHQIQSCTIFSYMKTLLLLLTTAVIASADQFSKYWYSGKAEIAVYDLKQSRYGKTRPGTVSLIFITEPFSKSKHVKLDNPSKAGADKANVLKLNTSKKYNTGIYPYSVMTSAFADIKSGELYKTNTSIQEWCGHVFSQANSDGKGGYKYQGFSYFEYSGDQESKQHKTALSEEIMLKVRLNKLTPKTQEMTLVPSHEMLRTLHIQPQPLKAKLNWEEDEKTRTVTISFQGAKNLETKINFNKDFPYVIQNWSESFDGRSGRETTTATLKTIQMLPYWSMNSPEFDGMRKEIGLE